MCGCMFAFVGVVTNKPPIIFLTPAFRLCWCCHRQTTDYLTIIFLTPAFLLFWCCHQQTTDYFATPYNALPNRTHQHPIHKIVPMNTYNLPETPPISIYPAKDYYGYNSASG